MENKNPRRTLREENERLKVAIEELTVLNDIATAISSTSSLEQIMELIIRKCIKHFKSEQGAVMLIDPKDKEKAFRTMIRRADTSENVLPYRLDTQLRGWMLKYQKPLLINDLQADDRFQLVEKEAHGIHSLLSVPLLFKGQMIGSLNVFNKRIPGGFTEAERRLLAIIATQSAQVIENARLSEEEQALLLMQEEMRLAYKIQMDLLPRQPPNFPGYDIAGKSAPAKVVGGDYYDFTEMGEHRIGLCLGDVSGKGMPAALLMANLQATLRGQTQQNLSPSVSLRRSNTLLLKSTDTDRFATLFFGILDVENHRLLYSNAGHNYPFLIRPDRGSRCLEAGGTVLGCFEDVAYIEDVVSLEPGDILVVYSDGITEAVDKRDEGFGEERLLKTIIEGLDDTAEQLIQRIIKSVNIYVGELPQMDDMTLVVVKRER